MAENTKSTTQADKLNGLFVRGVVMSSAAKVHKRKDGTGFRLRPGGSVALRLRSRRRPQAEALKKDLTLLSY